MPEQHEQNPRNAILDGYLGYWEATIQKWFAGAADNRFHGCSDDPFLREVEAFVQPNLMPEPYWGNPFDCSIVIANLNPGGGDDFDRSQPRSAHERAVVWLENRIRDAQSYRSVACSFPLLRSETELDAQFGPEQLLSDYGGRHWWRHQSGRIQWAEYMWHHAAPTATRPFRPFAMELCGWHSSGWNDRASRAVLSAGETTRTNGMFRTRVLLPLIEAVKKSDSHLGLCCGADWNWIFRTGCFREDIRPLCDHDPIPGDNMNYLASNRRRKYSLFEIDNENHIVVTSEGRGNPTPHWSSWPLSIDWLRELKTIR